MYYVSENKQELEAYNQLVSESENYDGISTLSWANIIEHKNGNQFAILINPKYEVDLPIIDSLEGWFDLDLV